MGRREKDVLAGWALIAVAIAYPFVWFYQTFGWGGYAVLAIALVTGLLLWSWPKKNPTDRTVPVTRINGATPTRDQALFYESLEIIRKSTSAATVESRYDLMRDICQRESGWANWSNELEEARQKRNTLFDKKIASDAQREAAQLEKRHARIFKKAAAIIAAQPGIVQSELLPMIKDYSPGEVRFALSHADKHGRLRREKYRSSYKLFLIDQTQGCPESGHPQTKVCDEKINSL